ncbi:MAG: NusG domain II-containing protein [Lachnospiraceae bacterium]|nr:NusG domain II-containing protein [Lachnospiraceae bacterium]
MKKKDLMLIFVLLIAATACIIPGLFRKGGSTAYLYVKGELYGTYDLSEDRDIHLESPDGTVNDIRIENGTAFMKYATCPEKLCMNGRISRNGESICCAPSGVLMLIRGEDDTGYDAITK